MTNPVSRPRWSDPHAEVVPLSRSTAEQELATLKRQHQDLQTRHAQLAATLAQLSKQYGATQPLPAAPPLIPPALQPLAPSLTPVPPLPSQPESRSEQRSDLSFLSDLRQRQAPLATPQPKQTVQSQIAPPASYPVQPLQPPQPLPQSTPQWQEAPQAWSEPRQSQPQPPAGYPKSQQPPAWSAAPAPTWGQPDTHPDNYDQQPQYDSLYEKVRHQQDDQSTPMWMWLVAAVVLLTISFGTGFLMVRHFIGRSAPPPPVENVN